MQISRRTLVIILGVIAIVLAVSLFYYVATSNLLLTSASAHFYPGPNDMNTLDIKAPYGWYCVEFYRGPSMFDSHKMEVMGKGVSECPLFGSETIWANYYPDSGGIDDIPLGQLTMIYQSADKTFELYVWIARDRAAIDQVEQFFDDQQPR